jgi:hypothetical protein
MFRVLYFVGMNLDKVINHFGSTKELCAVLDVSKGAISQWRKDGIPKLRRFQIETLTKGKFKAERKETAS